MEVMIGASLGSVVLLGVLTTFGMLLRSGVSASNYSVMEAQARRTFEQFGIDARMARSLTTGTNSVTLSFNPSAVPAEYASSNLVTYAYDSTNQWLYSVPGDGTSLTNQRVLIRNVASVTFNRYTVATTGTEASLVATTTDSAAKHIQVAITVRKSAATAATMVAGTENILSAAFTLRN